MRNKDIKKELKNIYQPPLPKRKSDFLKNDFAKSIRQHSVSNSYNPISMQQFLRTQLNYIRPWVWVISMIAFITALYLMKTLGNEAMWTISAMVPFLSASVVVELHRSVHYQMNELEQATRFSLKSVTYARLCILGMSNFILLAILSPFMVVMCHILPVEVITYLLCPYAMTAFLCLYIMRIWHSSDAIFACAGVSIIVCLLCFLNEKLTLLTISTPIYLLITFGLFALMLKEYKKYLTNLEELVWN